MNNTNPSTLPTQHNRPLLCRQTTQPKALSGTATVEIPLIYLILKYLRDLTGF